MFDMQRVIKIHNDEFGVDPVITGHGYTQGGDLVDKIMAAVELGEPYVEPSVADDVEI